MPVGKQTCLKERRHDTSLKKADCWECGTELMWGRDHDCDVESFSATGIAADENGDDIDFMHDKYDQVTFFRCPKCQSNTLVYRSREES